MFSFIFNQLLYKPLFNGLIFIYGIVPDFGIAIVFLTVIVRVILYPLMQVSLKSQRVISKIQPELKEIQKKHKNNKEEQMKEIMALYQKNSISPLALFIPFLALFVQVPILIALFYVFQGSFGDLKTDMLYSFIDKPQAFNPVFLGIVDLSAANILFAAFAGLSQFIQAKLMVVKDQKISNKGDFSAVMSKQMQYFMPFFTFIIASKMPAGLSLYWIASTLFTIFQQKIIIKTDK